MEHSLQSLPGYEVFEYKIILSPHEALLKQVMDIRKTFSDKYQVEQPVTSLPEITLVHFKQVKAFEERLTNRLKIIAMGSAPIKVEIKDYGSYPSHTIFLNVTSKLPITNLVKKIRHDAQKLMKLDADNKPYFIMEGHITIARKLKPWQFEKGWLEYSNRHFSGKFIAGKMLLLRRRVGEFKYKPIAGFEFQHLPVETKQGQLF